MRFPIAPMAALALLAGCGGGPTAEEENLSTVGNAPEMTANSATGPGGDTGNPSSTTGDTGAETPGGPVSDQGSGTGGDSGQ